MRFDFPESTRSVLNNTLHEAVKLRHTRIVPEHILLALLASSDPGITEPLARAGASASDVRDAILAAVPLGRTRVLPGPRPRDTAATKRILHRAMHVARSRGVREVTPAHLLAALLSDEQSVGAQVLRRFGVSLDDDGDSGGALVGAPVPRPGPVQIDDASSLSIHEQIVEQIKESVATGSLRPGERLPTVRRLADELQIAPGTVARAYGELERLGLVVTQGARGTRVAERRPVESASIHADTLTGLLRPVAVAAFHLGATADELRRALDAAMADIFVSPKGSEVE